MLLQGVSIDDYVILVHHHKLVKVGMKDFFISMQKVAGAFVKPKGIINHLYSLYLVTDDVFGPSPS